MKPVPRHNYEISARTSIKLEFLFLLLLDRLVHCDELRLRELLLKLSQEQMVDGVRPNDPPWNVHLVTGSATQEGDSLHGPKLVELILHRLVHW